MYIPFRHSKHFEALCEVFGVDTAIALCRQLAPNGDHRRIPQHPNPRLLADLGSQAHHANDLCYYFTGSFVYFPRLVNADLLDDARNGMSWGDLCDRHNINGAQLRLLLTHYMGVETRRKLFPKITAEMREYISHQRAHISA